MVTCQGWMRRRGLRAVGVDRRRHLSIGRQHPWSLRENAGASTRASNVIFEPPLRMIGYAVGRSSRSSSTLIHSGLLSLE